LALVFSVFSSSVCWSTLACHNVCICLCCGDDFTPRLKLTISNAAIHAMVAKAIAIIVDVLMCTMFGCCAAFFLFKKIKWLIF